MGDVDTSIASLPSLAFWLLVAHVVFCDTTSRRSNAEAALLYLLQLPLAF